jgi:hypothetical protein
MSDTDFTKPGLGPLRAAAGAIDLAHAASGLVGAYGCRLAGSDPLALLPRHIVRSMTEAGLTVHHCAPHHPLYRLGGACLLPVPAGPADSRAGIAVSWTTHNLLRLDGDRYSTHAGTRQAMNTAIGCILRAFGYAAEPLGSGGARLVTATAIRRRERDGDRDRRTGRRGPVPARRGRRRGPRDPGIHGGRGARRGGHRGVHLLLAPTLYPRPSSSPWIRL